MPAYYNEIDPYAAQWLRNLVAKGLIADGEVDTRSIVDVRADDVRGFTQCHFFAGIGGWSYALRLAGWPDDRPVWTGSCPCPPFSAAGKGSKCPSCGGRRCLSHPLVTAGWLCLDCGDEWRGDDRHLLPEFIRLMGQCRPATVFGEQVASHDGRLWFYTLRRATMEKLGYAVGGADLCAAGIGAPHIRQRLWFVGERLANANEQQLDRRGDAGATGRRELTDKHATGGLADASLDGRRQGIENGGRLRSGDRAEGSAGRSAVDSGLSGGLGHHHHQGLEGQRSGHQAEGGWIGAAGSVAEAGELGGMADADEGQCGRIADGEGREPDRAQAGWQQGNSEPQSGGSTGRPRPTNGHWRDADWLFCRDGKWRPVEPGTFPLAHGIPARVVRLRGYGNAIVPQVAAEVIRAYMEIGT